jgi:hypothetical protein
VPAPSSFTPELDVVRLHDRVPIFSFGVPWGWRDAEPDELGELLLTGIVTDRPDQITTAIVVQGPVDAPEWHDADGGLRLMAYADEFAEMRMRQPGLAGIGPISSRAPPEKAVLAGERALVLRMRQLVDRGVHESEGFWADTEVWTVHGGRAYGVLLQGPEVDTPVYEPDFHTVLGTWQWRS